MKEGLKAIIWLIVGLELLLVMFILFSKFLTNEKVNLDLDEEEQEELNNIIMPTFTKSDITDEIYRTIYNVSFIENNDITIEDLSYLEVTYYDLDGNKHIGDMIVNNKVADEVLLIFKELYDIRYPINKISLVDNYRAVDEDSMRDNNSSAFNYRAVSGTNTLSKHALGLAIDINPLYNPCVTNGTASIKESEKYINRKNYSLGMIQEDDDCVKIFKKYGWTWGGDWINPKDYQHFEKTID
ncbi:MAG: M15 family metallopeptidase [Clostridia bacterium]|nr:M15 family metallopeptidase [Clostridia bacterium]